MKRSKAFIPTKKRNGEEKETTSVELAERSGMIKRYGSGIFGFTPIGESILENMTRNIEEKMYEIGVEKISLPSLQNTDIWKESGRWESFGGEMFAFENKDGKEMCLAPTHEESVAEMIRGSIRSYKDLPIVLFQTGKKHRDDHPRNGLLRTKEFVMKDAYSFHSNYDNLDKIYKKMRDAYIDIFDDFNLEYGIVGANPGQMGGKDSEEFIAPSEIGSDKFIYCENEGCKFGSKDFELEKCPDCGGNLTESKGIEVGHIFKLGSRYSDPLGLQFSTEENERENVVMGSYGIGISRTIPAIIEQNNDEKGIKWPEEIAPYRQSIIPISYEGDMREITNEIYDVLPEEETLLYDDVEMSAGEKFAESDLIGIPKKIIIGQHFLDNDEIEIEDREGNKTYADRDYLDEFEDYLNAL